MELRPARAQALRDLARRMGAVVEVVEGGAGTAAGRLRRRARRPSCTGLGVLSARPDARWRRREESLEPLADLQRALLGRALALARPGGRVVYSTCTLIAEENEDVVAAAGAALDDLGPSTRGSPTRRPEALLLLPHRHGTAGSSSPGCARGERTGASGGQGAAVPDVG